jgi:uncharacterized membrane protein YebE (DUF533 family)
MDVEQLIGDVIRGALRARGKRHRGAWRALTGRHGSFVTPATIVGALGLAWGVYETMTASSPVAATPAAGQGTATPPPVPVSPDTAAASPSPASGTEVAAPSVPPDVARVIRLTVSAARADGTLTDAEQASILQHAGQAGAEAIVREELARPTPLASIVAGVADAVRPDLYRLAFTIVRADEAVSGGERIYLAQLAHALGLTPERAAAIEAEGASVIDAAGRDTPS